MLSPILWLVVQLLSPPFDMMPSLMKSYPARLARTAVRLTGGVLDVILPPTCCVCQTRLTTHYNLCAPCWLKIEFIGPPLCDRLGLPLPYGGTEAVISAEAIANPPVYNKARAAGIYTGTLKSLIHDFKFRDRQDVVPLLLRWLERAGDEFWLDAELLIPVPLHRYRILKRRFNQAAVLARSLSRRVDAAWSPDVLVRSRSTAQQVGLSPRQRQENVRGAFHVPSSKAHLVAGKSVILIDDVITTGATISECARALLLAGAKEVNVVVLAMVVAGHVETHAGGLLLHEVG